MCDDYGTLSEAETPVVDALREILTLNGELRKLRAETESAGTRRRQEYKAHVSTLNNINRDLGREVEMLRAKVIALTPYIPPRHVAEEMGLRSADARADAAEAAAEDRSRERRAAEFDALLAGAQQLREGMATASGLVAERGPDQK